jgi:TPR repeat protein
MKITKIWICMALAAGVFGLTASARAADDTARFYGSWQASFLFNGQMITMVSVHDASGFKNYVNNIPAGAGSYSATSGKYAAGADAPNDSGTYRFINENTVIATNSAGQTVTWKRINAAAPNAAVTPPAGTALAAAPPAGLAPDPSLPPETNAAIAALQQKDYNTAWRDFMAAAQKGDSTAEAGLGAMLFTHSNPPGTGYYAQCEKWLLESANQGNVKGMDLLAQYYYASGTSIAGGINPAANHAPIPPALRQQAEGRFALARQWFERAVAKNDGPAMLNLAILLDSGVGGPSDAARAAQLRSQAASLTDPNFVKRATADPEGQAMAASWQAGHYADALKNAQAQAAKGDAKAEALLGRAYYEGVGVARNYATALHWLNKAADQKNPDALFFLGLMYEWGRGVNQDLDKSQALLDEAAAMGQGDAKIEAGMMREEGAAAAQQARFAAVCRKAGGVADGPLCMVGDGAIDPY